MPLPSTVHHRRSVRCHRAQLPIMRHPSATSLLATLSVVLAVLPLTRLCNSSPVPQLDSPSQSSPLSPFTLDFIDNQQSSILSPASLISSRRRRLPDDDTLRQLEDDDEDDDDDDDDENDEENDGDTSFDHEQPSDNDDSNAHTTSDTDGLAPPPMSDSSTSSTDSTTTTDQNDAADDADDAEEKNNETAESSTVGDTDSTTTTTTTTTTNGTDPNDPATSNTTTTETTSETTPVNQTSTTDVNESGPNGTKSKTEEAFAQFELLEMQELNGESNDAFKLVLIFSNTSFVGPFAGSPKTSDISVLETADNASWYEETAIQDRISFQIRYDSELEAEYAITEPSVFVSAGADTGIEPKHEFQLYTDSGMGAFIIYYNCVMGKPGTFPIGIRIPVTKDHVIETGWLKTCGHGRFEYLNFGFLDHTSQFVPFNADGTYGVDEHRRLEVGPMDPSTDLKAQLKVPATNLEFLNPHVMSNSPDVGVKLRSTVAASTFLDDSETTFTVLYDCEAKATADIKFTVAIPPWDNVTATWRKDCGGSVSQALLIGTVGPKSFDVMQEGKLRPEFQVGPEETVNTTDTRITVVPADTHSQKFYFTNSDETSDIHFQKVSITLSSPSIMKVIVSSGNSRSSISSVGGILKRGEIKTLTLFFLCHEIGKSVVLVTVPTVRYQNVEFGFIKECAGAPKVYRHGGFLQTAGSLLDIILILAVGGGIAMCVYTVRKRAAGQKYSALSTTES